MSAAAKRQRADDDAAVGDAVTDDNVDKSSKFDGWTLAEEVACIDALESFGRRPFSADAVRVGLYTRFVDPQQPPALEGVPRGLSNARWSRENGWREHEGAIFRSIQNRRCARLLDDVCFWLLSEVVEAAAEVGIDLSDLPGDTASGRMFRVDDYRFIGVSHLELIDGDAVLHDRTGEYGNGPPMFFFDNRWIASIGGDGPCDFFVEFMSDVALQKLRECVARNEESCDRLTEIFDDEVSVDDFVGRLRGTAAPLPFPIVRKAFKFVSHGNDSWFLCDVRSEFSPIRHAYARLWLARVGRRERALRVARLIVHKLLGANGWGLAHLVCEMIAEFTVSA
jgi:hypothetical protein